MTTVIIAIVAGAVFFGVGLIRGASICSKRSAIGASELDGERYGE